MVGKVAAVIRKHVRLEWHGHDHADINLRSTVAAAEEIVSQLYAAIRSLDAERPSSAEAAIEAMVGGAYEMPDVRTFWIDAPVAREIARRAVGRRA